MALAAELQPTVIVFDGVVPYIGLLDALRQIDARSIWMRRGLWREDADTSPLKFSSWFDLVIEPSDLGDSHDVGPTASRDDALKVGVITHAAPEVALSREVAAERLGISVAKKTALINIGSSDIDDLAPVWQELAQHSDWQFITTKDSLGRDSNRSDFSLHTVAGIFPLYPYLSAVDLVVTAVGYNAAHETVGMGKAAIYVPAPTTTDDQYARALAIAETGAGWAVTDNKAATLAQTLHEILDNPEAIASAAKAAQELSQDYVDGAQQVAEILLNPIAPTAQRSLLRVAQLKLRVLFENVLGNAARRQSRKHHQSWLLTETLNAENLASIAPFEHVLPATSPSYLQARTGIAQRWLC